MSWGDTLLSLLNYVLEKGMYPEKWAECLISPVHEAGSWNNVNNYRCITVQSAISKILDIMMTFILEVSKKAVVPSDNMFVLLSVIQRQKALGKPLYITFIDFKRAFDSVNRSLLFYKLITSGYLGKLITLINDQITGKDQEPFV